MLKTLYFSIIILLFSSLNSHALDSETKAVCENREKPIAEWGQEARICGSDVVKLVNDYRCPPSIQSVPT